MTIALPFLVGLFNSGRHSAASLVSRVRDERHTRETVSANPVAGQLLELCARQQDRYWSLTRELAHIDLAPVLRLQALSSHAGMSEARRLLHLYEAVLARRQLLLLASLQEMESLLRTDGQHVDAAGKAGVVFRTHRLASMTIFKDLNASQSQVLATLSDVLSWLEGQALHGRNLAADGLLALSDRQCDVMRSMLANVLRAQERTHALVLKVAAVQQDTQAVARHLRAP